MVSCDLLEFGPVFSGGIHLTLGLEVIYFENIHFLQHTKGRVEERTKLGDGMGEPFKCQGRWWWWGVFFRGCGGGGGVWGEGGDCRLDK